MTAKVAIYRTGELVSVLTPLPIDRAYDYRVPPEMMLGEGDMVEVAVGPKYLVPLWGAPLAGTFDRALPAFNDRDVRFGVTLDHLAEVRASVGFSERAPLDEARVRAVLLTSWDKLRHIEGAAFLCGDACEARPGPRVVRIQTRPSSTNKSCGSTSSTPI